MALQPLKPGITISIRYKERRDKIVVLAVKVIKILEAYSPHRAFCVLEFPDGRQRTMAVSDQDLSEPKAKAQLI